ncbi:hypothetical protein [Chromobacterium violaceum]|uniref:hypothetical protein n=1 Tax=Chromobacterium violaceum TaxID=536 RepID=UPI00111C8D2B|nr:hypothetical protein [Chromobacterium violaceum]
MEKFFVYGLKNQPLDAYDIHHIDKMVNVLWTMQYAWLMGIPTQRFSLQDFLRRSWKKSGGGWFALNVAGLASLERGLEVGKLLALVPDRTVLVVGPRLPMLLDSMGTWALIRMSL